MLHPIYTCLLKYCLTTIGSFVMKDALLSNNTHALVLIEYGLTAEYIIMQKSHNCTCISFVYTVLHVNINGYMKARAWKQVERFPNIPRP